MVFRVISYNLLHSRALGELAGLVASESEVDALCLQEVHSGALPERIGHLQLTEHTRRNELSLAVYHRPDRFETVSTSSFELKRGLHDMMFERQPERLVGAHLRERDSGAELVLGSFHAAPLTSRNALRRKQISAAHDRLVELGEGAPILMAGDFNYPLFHNRLGERLEATGFELIRSDKRTYSAFKVIRGHFDFVTAHGLEVRDVATLRRGVSDHSPILVTASAAAVERARAAS